MKKYTRISASFTYDGNGTALTDDALVAEEINKKLNDFLKKVKPKSYDIINTETHSFDKDDKFRAIYFVYLHLQFEV